jgi:nitroreductase
MSIDPDRLSPPLAENDPTALPVASPDTLDLLARRRSAKPFFLAAPAPSATQLDAILRLASRTPDHGKLNPWRFIVFEGEGAVRAGAALADVLEKSGDATEETLKAARETFTRAPLVVAVVSTAKPNAKIPEWEQVLAAGAVSYAVLIAATAFGFGGVWLTGWPAYNADARAALGLADDEKLAAFIHLGTQTQTQPERVRPDMAALVTRY